MRKTEDMTGTRTSPILTIARIIAGIIAVAFVSSTVTTLGSLVSELTRNKRPLVVMALFSESAFFAVLSIIFILFTLRGNLPAIRRQTGSGCFFNILIGFIGSGLAALIFAILDLDTGSEAALTITISYLSAALAGGLGLYLARPTYAGSGSGRGMAEDQLEFDQGAHRAENPEQLKTEPRPRPPWLGSFIIAGLGAVATFIPGFYLGVIIFELLLHVLPWCPPQVLRDTGEGFAWYFVFSLPLVLFLGGLIGYLASRVWQARREKVDVGRVAILSGIASGLVLIVILSVGLAFMACNG